ncbi:MAG: thermonuclease family protein [Kiloniellaceae bacterium]
MRRSAPATCWRLGILLGVLGSFSVEILESAPAAERLGGPVPAQVVRVIDGDTIQVRARIWLDQEVETRVRLDGVDAPELKARCARERAMAVQARAFLDQRLAAPGAPVFLSDIRYGKYAGRVLARVRDASGADLAEALIAAGLARPYAGKRRASWCPDTG